MRLPARAARPKPLPLAEVAGHLVRRDFVDGALLMGSRGTDAHAPSSDHDPLLVVSDIYLPLGRVIPCADGSLIEVSCATISAIERVAARALAWPSR